MINLIYMDMLQAAIDNQEKRDLAQQDLSDHLDDEATSAIEPEVWELLPV